MAPAPNWSAMSDEEIFISVAVLCDGKACAEGTAYPDKWRFLASSMRARANRKRFLLFAGNTYYPAGGWNDLRGSFDTPEAAVEYLTSTHSGLDWWQVVDTISNEVVKEG